MYRVSRETNAMQIAETPDLPRGTSHHPLPTMDCETLPNLPGNWKLLSENVGFFKYLFTSSLKWMPNGFYALIGLFGCF